jgi:acetyl esterase/lipase
MSSFLKKGDIESARLIQTRCGELMARMAQHEVDVSRPLPLGAFEVCCATPRVPEKQGVILYLHGGGYTCGDISYASGFGSALCEATGRAVLCAAYRLAPENPFPAALEDALAAWEHLMDTGFSPSDVVLCGESAGGGLLLALCLKLRELGRELPAGIIPVSPWTDLTLSGGSMRTNRECDPTLSLSLLSSYVRAYAPAMDIKNPYISPCFADFAGFPPALIFAGGDELILSDAERLHESILLGGGRSELWVEPHMWHAYVLYGLPESKKAMRRICAFTDGILG